MIVQLHNVEFYIDLNLPENEVMSFSNVNTNRKRKTATLWKADQMLHRPTMSMWP